MSFDDWDVDKYRKDYESDEHWQLKKDFMEGEWKLRILRHNLQFIFF